MDDDQRMEITGRLRHVTEMLEKRDDLSTEKKVELAHKELSEIWRKTFGTERRG